MKRTPWFDGSVKPVHVGVYERYLAPACFSRWDGRYWLFSAPTPETADAMTVESSLQDLPWRGLTQPAKD